MTESPTSPNLRTRLVTLAGAWIRVAHYPRQRPTTPLGAVLLVSVCLHGLCAYAVEPNGEIPPAGFREVGGSNYVMFHVDPAYRERREEGSWYRPGVLHPVVGTFHLQSRQEVIDQLDAMHDGGQRKIALLVWHCRLPDGVGVDGIHGHVVASNGGTLSTQHAENLRGFLALLRETKHFNELIFRFALQGISSPDQWEEWDEDLYEESWQFLVHTRDLVETALAGSGMRILYDLGAELGGIDTGKTRAYVRRLWKDYTARFGATDTCGFSVANHPGRVQRLLEDFDAAGTRPALFALDVYDHLHDWLGAAAKEFNAAGIERPRVIIQETYYNDPVTLEELQRVQRDFHYDFLYLMQWPIERGHPTPHFSMDFPARYDAYLRHAAASEGGSTCDR